MPSLVRPRGLDRANSRMQASDLLVQNFIATPLAGLAFAVTIGLPIWSAGAGYLIAGVLAMLLPFVAGRARPDADEVPEVVVARSTRSDIVEVTRFIVGHRLLRDLVLLSTLVGCALAFAQGSAILLFLEDFDVPEAMIGFITAGVGLGALTGALLATRLVDRFGRRTVMFGATLLAGVGLTVTGFADNVVVAIAGYALSGFGVSVWNVPWGALRQRLVPGHMLGRAIGAIRTINWGFFPVASIAGGYFARIDLGLPFILGGAAVAIAALSAGRMLRRADDVD